MITLYSISNTGFTVQEGQVTGKLWFLSHLNFEFFILHLWNCWGLYMESDVCVYIDMDIETPVNSYTAIFAYIHKYA